MPESVGGTLVADRLLRALHVLTAVVIFQSVALVAVVVVGVGYANYKTNQITDSLCTLRGDLQRRVEQGQEFLKENPEGIEGIPPETLQQSIEGQQRTITALSTLDC